MDSDTLIIFLVLVALGSYVQTVSGFAIALIIAGGVALFDIASIAFTANVISFIAVANVASALHRQHNHIDKPMMIYSSIGVLLLLGPGLLLLHYLSHSTVELLKVILGMTILASGVLLMIHPHPLKKVSSTGMHLLAGGFGGLLAGLFGAGGPPLVIHLYRQPLAFNVIRTTLLAILGIMPLLRILIETVAGNIDGDIIYLSLLSIPVSILFTVMGRRYPPPVSELVIRQTAFGLLAALGLSLILMNFDVN